MDVSIILPVYNGENFLANCLDSILGQTFKDYELIIVDDGSTDSSSDICTSYAFKFKHFKFYKQKNLGVSAARNFGLSKAQGTYILFIDSDDLYDQNFVRNMLNAIRESKVDIACCNYRTIDSKNNVLYDSHFDAKIRQLKNTRKFLTYTFKTKAKVYLQTWRFIFLNEIIKNNNLKFNENIAIGEDALFVRQYLLRSKTIKLLNESLYFYRINAISATNRYNEKQFTSSICLIKEYTKLFKDNGIDLKCLNDYKVGHYLINFRNIIKSNLGLIQILKTIQSYKIFFEFSHSHILFNFFGKDLLILLLSKFNLEFVIVIITKAKRFMTS